MPTYRNDSNSSIPVQTKRKSIAPKLVMPGETVITEEIQLIGGLILVSPTPYYNPVAHKESVIFAEAETKSVNLHAEAVTFIVRNVTGCSVTVFIGDTGNTPGVSINESEYYQLADANRLSSTFALVSDGAGTCEVVQTKENLLMR